MDATVIGILVLDGLSNGAVYALLGMALVLLFSVTRVIFIPQGELVAYGALSLAMLQAGQTPGTVWLLLGSAGLAALVDAVDLLRRRAAGAEWLRTLTAELAAPTVLSLLTIWAAPRQWPLIVQAALSLALVTLLGRRIYRLAYESLADASVLVLLIVSVGVHTVLQGLGLIFFGAEGFRTPPFWDERFTVGALTLSGQTLITWVSSGTLIALLALYFSRTLQGKALQATAVNRLGARLMGISSQNAGRTAFTLAAFIGGLSGLLIGPTTTVFYDSGFLIGLKGFVAAILAGLSSFVVAGASALGVGLLESFGAFWASSYKEVIVFTAILPGLLWRSLLEGHHEDDE